MKRDTSTIALLLLLSLGVIALGCWGFWEHQRGKSSRSALADLQRTSTESQQATEDEFKKILTELDTNWQATLTENDRVWEEKIATQQEENLVRIGLAYERFDELLNNSGQALSYIDDLETRLKGAALLSEAELGELIILANGLRFLKAQYQKPLSEFDAMAGYLEARANHAIAAPNTRMSGFKRIFSGRFRKEEKAYLQEVASREAYHEMNKQFQTAYWRAQRSMEKAGGELDNQLAAINALLGKKEASYSDLGEFIGASKEILKVHKGILDFDPGDLPSENPPSPNP